MPPANKASLTESQLAVLRWAADGCPAGMFEDARWKVSAYVLRDRRLLTVSKHGGGFAVGVTEAGEHYLDHGDYPDGHWLTRRLPKPAGRSGLVVETPKVSTPAKPRKPAVPRVPASRQLVLDVVASGGRLEIDNRTPAHSWSQVVARVKAAIRYGFIPEGKLLRSEGGYGRKHVVELVDQPEWMTRTLDPIRVPASLTKPHPVVQQIRDDKRILQFTAPARKRALRLLQALVAEAVRRGYRVPGINKDEWGRRDIPHRDGVIVIEILGHRVALGVAERNDRIAHVPTKKEIADHERYSPNRIPTHDSVPNGRLSLRVHGGYEYRQSGWNDGKQALEELLPEVLQEVELRANGMEERRLEEVERKAAEQRAWEHAFAQAEISMIEAHRASVLDQQLERWERAGRIAAYLIEMRVEVDGITDEAERTATTEWVAWATEHVKDANPLRHALHMPAAQQPTAENMKPHLGRWSFYGPSRY